MEQRAAAGRQAWIVGLRALAYSAALLGWVAVSGCASEPKEPPPRSVNEIRSDSDRFFDKMQQEEHESVRGPASPAQHP